jgi:hypothetical protein
MELSQIFSFLVLGICATHVVWMASAQITSWWDIRKKSRPQTVLKSGPQQQRSDWYVFFNCADLLGPDPGKKVTDSARENKTQTTQKKPRPQIRQNAH